MTFFHSETANFRIAHMEEESELDFSSSGSEWVPETGSKKERKKLLLYKEICFSGLEC